MTANVFDFLSKELGRKKIPCVLIGGFAVNHYKVSRQTADVDFLIKEEDLKKIETALVKAGYKTKDERKPFVRFKSDKPAQMDVDFMFVDANTLNEILRGGQKVRIAGNTFTVPSLDHLIALKLHSIKHNKKRELKDLPDIINLIKQNGVDVKKSSLRNLCVKYGTDELYRKIKEHAEA
jgi:predicted nucleotidyltransferase